MKHLFVLLAASAASLCACTSAPSPTAPTPTAIASTTFAGNAEFEPEFFRALLQNGYESPNRLEPIRLLRGPLRLYLRTHDERGQAIDRASLDHAERTLIESAGIWSGGTFDVAQVERGTGTREKTPGPHSVMKLS